MTICNECKQECDKIDIDQRTEKCSKCFYKEWKTATYEFNFMGQNLEKTAKILLRGKEEDIREALFLIGCMHSNCCWSAEYFRKECKADLHE